MLKQVTYQAVFEPTAGSGFSVYFPDLPGCTSYGDTLSEAQKNAQDALALHLYGMEKDGDSIPAPSAAPEIDPETAPGYFVCPVTVFALLHYRGYATRPEYSSEDGIFYGKLLRISDLVDIQSESAKELEANTDKYIEISQKQDVFITENGKIVAKLTACTE